MCFLVPSADDRKNNEKQSTERGDDAHSQQLRERGEGGDREGKRGRERESEPSPPDLPNRRKESDW